MHFLFDPRLFDPRSERGLQRVWYAAARPGSGWRAMGGPCPASFRIGAAGDVRRPEPPGTPPRPQHPAHALVVWGFGLQAKTVCAAGRGSLEPSRARHAPLVRQARGCKLGFRARGLRRLRPRRVLPRKVGCRVVVRRGPLTRAGPLCTRQHRGAPVDLGPDCARPLSWQQ